VNQISIYGVAPVAPALHASTASALEAANTTLTKGPGNRRTVAVLIMLGMFDALLGAVRMMLSGAPRNEKTIIAGGKPATNDVPMSRFQPAAMSLAAAAAEACDGCIPMDPRSTPSGPTR